MVLRFALVILVASLGGSAVAEIINVPADFATIQAAIDAAVDGDEVVVADGSYTGAGIENLDLRGKAVTLRPEYGSPGVPLDAPPGDGNLPLCFGNDSDDPICEFGVGLQTHMLPPGLYSEYGVTTGKHVQAPGSALRGYTEMTVEQFLHQYSDEEILESFVDWLAAENIDIHDPEIVISWYVDKAPLRPKNWGQLLDEDPVLYIQVIEAYKNRLEIADDAFDGKLMLWGFTGFNGIYSAAFTQMYEGFQVAIALGVLDHVDALGVNHFLKSCPTDPYYVVTTTNRVNQEVDMMASLLGDAGLTGTKTWAPFFTLQYLGSATCNQQPVHSETLRLNSDLYQAAKEAGLAPDLDMIWIYETEPVLPPYFTTQLSGSQMVPLHCFCDVGQPALAAPQPESAR